MSPQDLKRYKGREKRENGHKVRRQRVKEISYRDREEEDKDDRRLGTSCIWADSWSHSKKSERSGSV